MKPEIGSEAWIKAQIAAGKGTDERDAPRPPTKEVYL